MGEHAVALLLDLLDDLLLQIELRHRRARYLPLADRLAHSATMRLGLCGVGLGLGA